jgi:hypothetical protein
MRKLLLVGLGLLSSLLVATILIPVGFDVVNGLRHDELGEVICRLVSDYGSIILGR